MTATSSKMPYFVFIQYKHSFIYLPCPTNDSFLCSTQGLPLIHDMKYTSGKIILCRPKLFSRVKFFEIRSPD